MATIYEVMKHNYQNGVVEKGVATLLHPLYNNGEIYAFALQFYQTDVVTAYPDGSVRLDSGGYSTPHYAWSRNRKTQSPTTRERISRYLPSGCQIYQKSNAWYVSLPNGDVLFEDGMIIRIDLTTSDRSALQPLMVGYDELGVN